VKRRILLVDDNELFLDSARDVLESEGYTVITAESGEQALARVRLNFLRSSSTAKRSVAWSLTSLKTPFRRCRHAAPRKEAGLIVR